MSALEKQVGGNHYSKFKIQPSHYAYHNGLDCYQFNVIKYISRHKFKNGKQDLMKAIDEIEKLIELEYGE